MPVNNIKQRDYGLEICLQDGDTDKELARTTCILLLLLPKNDAFCHISISDPTPSEYGVGYTCVCA